MGVAGLFLGLKGQDVPSDAWWTVLTVIWFAGIGFSIGSIFDQKYPTKRVVIYWVILLGLVAPFWAMPVAWMMQPGLANLSFGLQAPAVGMGMLIGMVLGLGAGALHLKRIRRPSQRSVSGV
jgi:hypothetical protein